MEGISLKCLICEQSGITVYNDFGILQADKGDKQTNTYADCRFQSHGNGIENSFSDIRQ